MNITRSHFVRRLRYRGTLALAGLLAIIALVTGCSLGSSSPAAALADNEKILATCDRAHPPATWVGIDGTGSSAANYIYNERMTALQAIVQQTTVCSGYLKVVVFSSDSAATTVLFDSSLAQSGATDNARLQRVPNAVTSVMATVTKAYGPAAAGLDPRDSDITGQYQNAADFTRQLGGSYRLRLILLTDGFQTAGIDLYGQALDHRQATDLAQQTVVPSLPGAEIMVAGLGRVVGPTPPSPVVDGLIDYYNALCQKAGAARCLSVSNEEAAGW